MWLSNGFYVPPDVSIWGKESISKCQLYKYLYINQPSVVGQPQQAAQPHAAPHSLLPRMGERIRRVKVKNLLGSIKDSLAVKSKAILFWWQIQNTVSYKLPWKTLTLFQPKLVHCPIESVERTDRVASSWDI